MSLNTRITNFKTRLAQTGVAAPTLVAATKTRTVDEIEAAKLLGLTHFGENYVQEAQAKKAAFKGTTLHLIGPLQSNKADIVADFFDVIHTLGKEKTAAALNKELTKRGRSMDGFIQVNIAGEDTKSGCRVSHLPALIDYIKVNCPHLHLIGLMAMPPAGEDPAPYFKQMAALQKQHQLPALSIGMSGDWQTALQYGATHIRIGTALFGARKNLSPEKN